MRGIIFGERSCKLLDAPIASGAAVFLGKAIGDCSTPYNGGLKVALDWKWCRNVFGERNWRLLDTLYPESPKLIILGRQKVT